MELLKYNIKVAERATFFKRIFKKHSIIKIRIGKEYDNSKENAY